MESRLEPARRRAGTAKRALTGVAAVGFVAAALLARASHPGHAQTSPSDGSSTSSVVTPSDDGSGDDGSGYYQAPQVQTHVS